LPHTGCEEPDDPDDDDDDDGFPDEANPDDDEPDEPVGSSTLSSVLSPNLLSVSPPPQP
jgi:hypothetical protein